MSFHFLNDTEMAFKVRFKIYLKRCFSKLSWIEKEERSDSFIIRRINNGPKKRNAVILQKWQLPKII